MIAAKGLERASGLRLSEVVLEERPERTVAALSGPSFALEVARGLPTAVTVASECPGLARTVAELLASPAFRPYPSEDLAGVELAGALKNVIAIAAGVTMGKGLGENARAALITRGLAEMTRLALTLGARRETLMGLAGLGDLILTATSLTSRNTSFGHALAQGSDPARLLAQGRLSEGAYTAEAACRLGRSAGVELPIAEAVRAVVAGELGWTRRSTDCSRGRCRSASDDQARPSSLRLLDPVLPLHPARELDRVVDALHLVRGQGGDLAEAPDPEVVSFFSITLPMPLIAVRSSAAGLAGAAGFGRDRLGSGRLDRRLAPRPADPAVPPRARAASSPARSPARRRAWPGRARPRAAWPGPRCARCSICCAIRRSLVSPSAASDCRSSSWSIASLELKWPLAPASRRGGSARAGTR